MNSSTEASDDYNEKKQMPFTANTRNHSTARLNFSTPQATPYSFQQRTSAVNNVPFYGNSTPSTPMLVGVIPGYGYYQPCHNPSSMVAAAYQNTHVLPASNVHFPIQSSTTINAQQQKQPSLNTKKQSQQPQAAAPFCENLGPNSTTGNQLQTSNSSTKTTVTKTGIQTNSPPPCNNAILCNGYQLQSNNVFQITNNFLSSYGTANNIALGNTAMTPISASMLSAFQRQQQFMKQQSLNNPSINNENETNDIESNNSSSIQRNQEQKNPVTTRTSQKTGTQTNSSFPCNTSTIFNGYQLQPSNVFQMMNNFPSSYSAANNIALGNRSMTPISESILFALQQQQQFMNEQSLNNPSTNNQNQMNDIKSNCSSSAQQNQEQKNPAATRTSQNVTKIGTQTNSLSPCNNSILYNGHQLQPSSVFQVTNNFALGNTMTTISAPMLAAFQQQQLAKAESLYNESLNNKNQTNKEEINIDSSAAKNQEHKNHTATSTIQNVTKTGTQTNPSSPSNNSILYNGYQLQPNNTSETKNNLPSSCGAANKIALENAMIASISNSMPPAIQQQRQFMMEQSLNNPSINNENETSDEESKSHISTHKNPEETNPTAISTFQNHEIISKNSESDSVNATNEQQSNDEPDDLSTVEIEQMLSEQKQPELQDNNNNNNTETRSEEESSTYQNHKFISKNSESDSVNVTNEQQSNDKPDDLSTVDKEQMLTAQKQAELQDNKNNNIIETKCEDDSRFSVNSIYFNAYTDLVSPKTDGSPMKTTPTKKERGRPPKKNKNVPQVTSAKKRNPPKNDETPEITPRKKRGRPPKNNNNMRQVTSAKKRKPPKNDETPEIAPRKKRGRPPKNNNMRQVTSAKKKPPKNDVPEKTPRKKKGRPVPTTTNEKTRKSPNTITAKTPGESPNEVYRGAATDLPLGWTLTKVERMGGKTRGHLDRYWYSPKTQKKLRSMTEVKRFLMILDEVNGDEVEAWNLFRK